MKKNTVEEPSPIYDPGEFLASAIKVTTELGAGVLTDFQVRQAMREAAIYVPLVNGRLKEVEQELEQVKASREDLGVEVYALSMALEEVKRDLEIECAARRAYEILEDLLKEKTSRMSKQIESLRDEIDALSYEGVER